jgi:receptor protein-tyrosine kinase
VSIIEQAARRLEELRRAGVDVKSPAAPDVTGTGAGKGAWGAGASQASRPPPPHSGTPSTNVVHIDPAHLAQLGYVVPNAARSRLADELRAIKRPLLDNVRGKSAAPVQRANCLLVTSSMPGEGKTFTAINLALSMAMEVDSHVLLIDADVIQPTVLSRLGIPASRGLLDKLNERDLPLSDLILRTNIEKLSVLPAGRENARATELLASDSMRNIVDELASRYQDRIIIFDAPPLLAAPETRVLASHVGQIIVVVEAQKTPRHTLSEALSLVEACPVVLTMLNKATGPMMPTYGYAYGGHA